MKVAFEVKNTGKALKPTKNDVLFFRWQDVVCHN